MSIGRDRVFKCNAGHVCIIEEVKIVHGILYVAKNNFLILSYTNNPLEGMKARSDAGFR